MRTRLARTFFFLMVACWPACPSNAQAPANGIDPAAAAVSLRLDSIFIDRFGVPAGPMSDRGIRRQLAFLTARSQQIDPAHVGVTLRLRASPIDPQPPAARPNGNPGYRPMRSWEYVPLRVLLNYICKANGLSYDIENGQVVLFHPDQRVIVL